MKFNRKKTVNELLDACLNHKAVKKDLAFFVLLGSTQTNEAVEGYSDLDILLILKSNKSGAIRPSTTHELKRISKGISQNSGQDISLLTHTIFDFEEYVDFNYLLHYSWGKVLFGSPKAYKELFKKIIEKKYSDKARKDLMYYNLIHARFNLLRQYVSWNEFNKVSYIKSILRLVIDKVIEVCDWALAYRGEYAKTKKEVVEKFNKNFKLKKFGHVPQQTLLVRAEWNNHTFKAKEFSTYLKDAVGFIQELVEIIWKEHAKD